MKALRINLHDLTIENIYAWPPIIKKWAISLACLFSTILWLLLDTRVQLEQLKNEEKIAKELKKQTAFKSLPDKSKNIHKNFSLMMQHLPDKTEYPRLLESLSKIGEENGLNVTLFKPLQEKRLDFYTEVPIEISIVGTYHNLSQFISQILNLDHIVTLHDFSLEPISTGSETLVMNMLAKTYRYIDQKSARPPSTPPTKPPATFSYAAAHLRSPFESYRIENTEQRVKELLESFPITALQMVGTIKKSGTHWAMISTTHHTVHQITIGSYIGQHNGRVTAISDNAVEVTELISGAEGLKEKKVFLKLVTSP
jgi:type IV pilus assembly protein PilO